MQKIFSDGGEKNIGIWIRVSTEDQAHGDSPEHHEKRARYYAESKGWTVKEVYHLEAVSGKSVMSHPETARMLDDVRTGRITGLVFSKLARLARNTKELLDFSEIFREYNADLVSLQESIDTSTPAGRLFYTMIAAMAQWEREEISERVAASVPIRAKLGKSTGGQAPFGYRWVDKKLVLDPKEAPIRRLVFDLFLEHRRKRTVARLLNESGHRTRTGAKFSDTTVNRLLTEPIGMGQRRANYTKSLGQKKHWKLKPKDQWVFTEVEPIVPESVWTQCQNIINTLRSKQKRATKKAVHLFTGLVVCQCGGKMSVPSNSPKYICRKCKNKIPTPDLEDIYHDQLKSFLYTEDEMNGYLSQANKLIVEKENLLASLVEEKQRIRQELDHIIRLYLDNQMPKESVAKHYLPQEERLKQIESQLPELQGEIDYLKIQYLSSDQIRKDAQDVYGRWQEMDFTEKRAMVEEITSKIIVGTEEVSINLAYLPSSAELMANEQRNNRGS